MSKREFAVSIHAGHNPDGMTACGAVSNFGKESTEARLLVNEICKILKAKKIKHKDITVNDGRDQIDILKKLVYQMNDYNYAANISIHFNSALCMNSHGTEAFVWSDTSQIAKSGAEALRKMEALGFTNRRVKLGRSLYVIRKTHAPTILFEVGFISNGADVERAQKHREEIAQIIADFIISLK